MFILDSDLNLSVRPHPRDNFLLPALFDSPHKFGGKVVGDRHVIFSFISCIPDHKALISSSDVFFLSVEMDSLSNLLRLFIDSNNDGCSSVVHSHVN